MNGNIAVGILGGSIDFGTRGDSIHLSSGDIHYIQQLKDALNSGSFRNLTFNHVIFGNDINVEIKDGKVYVNGQLMNNLKPEEVFKDGNIQYIDFTKVFNRLISASNFYSNQETSAGVKWDFSDMNNQYVDVSNAKPTDNVIYVNIPANILQSAQPINIRGLSSKTDGPTMVINVVNADGTINVATQVHLYYDASNTPIHNSESHTVSNHVLWNFGSKVKTININSGRFMGSILAPSATVNAGVNIDGNIIANIVNISGGESHRWDIHPVTPPSFIEIPDPDPDPDPEPTPDPEPEGPKPSGTTSESFADAKAPNPVTPIAPVTNNRPVVTGRQEKATITNTATATATGTTATKQAELPQLGNSGNDAGKLAGILSIAFLLNLITFSLYNRRKRR